MSSASRCGYWSSSARWTITCGHSWPLTRWTVASTTPPGDRGRREAARAATARTSRRRRAAPRRAGSQRGRRPAPPGSCRGASASSVCTAPANPKSSSSRTSTSAARRCPVLAEPLHALDVVGEPRHPLGVAFGVEPRREPSEASDVTLLGDPLGDPRVQRARRPAQRLGEVVGPERTRLRWRAATRRAPPAPRCDRRTRARPHRQPGRRPRRAPTAPAPTTR